MLPYWGNPHDRKVIRKFWSQVSLLGIAVQLLQEHKITELIKLTVFCPSVSPVENPLHPECSFSCSDHQLPAGGAGCEVLPESEVAVHGFGRGPGAEEQHQVM